MDRPIGIRMKNKKEVWPVQNSSISAGWKTEVVVESGSANWAEKKARTLDFRVKEAYQCYHVKQNVTIFN